MSTEEIKKEQKVEFKRQCLMNAVYWPQYFKQSILPTWTFLAISPSIIVRFSKFKKSHTQQKEPVVSNTMVVVRTACLSSQVTTWRQIWNTAKLSAAAFYRRFLGWVIKKIRKEKTDTTGGHAVNGPKDPWPVSCRCPEPSPRWFVGDPTSLAHDTRLLQKAEGSGYPTLCIQSTQ